MRRKSIGLCLLLIVLTGAIVWWHSRRANERATADEAQRFTRLFHGAPWRRHLPHVPAARGPRHLDRAPAGSSLSDRFTFRFPGQPSPSPAQAVPDDDLVKREVALRNALKSAGEKFQSGGMDYRVLPNVAAIPASSFSESEGANVIDRRLGYVFVQLAPGDGTPPNGRSVVYDESAGRLGVITGALSVKFASSDAAEALAQDYDLQLIQRFDQLNVSYYQSTKSQPSDLLQLIHQMKSDRRVASVNLQILEHTVKPR